MNKLNVVIPKKLKTFCFNCGKEIYKTSYCIKKSKNNYCSNCIGVWRIGVSPATKGKTGFHKWSEEQKNIMSEKRKLKFNWNQIYKEYKNGLNTKQLALKYGVVNSTIWKNFKKLNFILRNKGETKLAENNPNWKGDAVGYHALHSWITRNKPKPEFCAYCKKKPYDLANISGEYKRDINDFEWLCRSCHMKKDDRLKNNLKQYEVDEKRTSL